MRQERLNDKTITLYEILKQANESETPVASIKEHIAKDSRIATVLGYSLNPSWKMPLPAGIPPYIPSQHPLGIAPLEILKTHNKLYIMYSRDTKQYKKEEIFIQWLEDMAPEEAELMVSIKDQTLPSHFDKLNLDVYLDVLGWSRQQYQDLLAKSASLPQV
jgi:hypothetical protein